MSKGLAVIIETRRIENIADIVCNHKKYSGFDVWFFHGASNKDFVRSELGDEVSRYINIGVDHLSSDGYNCLLTSTWLWKLLPEEKILIFQHDSRLLREGIEEFMEYDYVGAPWKFQLAGGNGGLSLRSRSIMLKLVEETPYRGMILDGNEDVWGSNNIEKVGGKLAPREVCSRFSCESIYAENTFGYHAIEKYLTKVECNNILAHSQDLYDIEDKNGSIMPRHYSGRARTKEEAEKLINNLNNNGEYKPYKLVKA